MKSKNKTKKVLRGRAAGIVLEDIDSKLDLVIEKVEGSEQRVMGEISEIKGDTSVMKKDIMDTKKDVFDIKKEIVDIRGILYRQDERIESEFKVLEKHEEEISALKVSARHF